MAAHSFDPIHIHMHAMALFTHVMYRTTPGISFESGITMPPKTFYDCQNMGFEPQINSWFATTLTTRPNRQESFTSRNLTIWNVSLKNRQMAAPSYTVLIQNLFTCRLHFSPHNVPNYPESSRGRVVKATDSKSVSLWERRFESCRLRTYFAILWTDHVA